MTLFSILKLKFENDKTAGGKFAENSIESIELARVEKQSKS